VDTSFTDTMNFCHSNHAHYHQLIHSFGLRDGLTRKWETLYLSHVLCLQPLLASLDNAKLLIGERFTEAVRRPLRASTEVSSDRHHNVRYSSETQVRLLSAIGSVRLIPTTSPPACWTFNTATTKQRPNVGYPPKVKYRLLHTAISLTLCSYQPAANRRRPLWSI